MQSIKYNKENCFILNQICGIQVELQEKDKKIILCEVPTHIVIKRNEKADKVAKQALDKNDHNKTTLYRLISKHQESEKF